MAVFAYHEADSYLTAFGICTLRAPRRDSSMRLPPVRLSIHAFPLREQRAMYDCDACQDRVDVLAYVPWVRGRLKSRCACAFCIRAQRGSLLLDLRAAKV